MAPVDYAYIRGVVILAPGRAIDRNGSFFNAVFHGAPGLVPVLVGVVLITVITIEQCESVFVQFLFAPFYRTEFHLTLPVVSRSRHSPSGN